MPHTHVKFIFLARTLHQRHLSALSVEGLASSLGRQIHYVRKQMSHSETADESEVSDASSTLLQTLFHLKYYEQTCSR